jgi:O-antigen/teichoic acid export membrane protein
MKATLSQQVAGATAWNTLLLPARVAVGLLASVIYFERLSREEVALVFLLTSLATTIGLYSDFGIERSLPRFLPEVEERAGREGVLRLLRGVLKAKMAVLLLLLGGLALLGRPLLGHLEARETGAAARLEEKARALPQGAPARATLLDEATARRHLAAEVRGDGAILLGAVGFLVVLGAFFDVHMQLLAAYFRQRSWNLITLVNTLLQPLLVTALVLLGTGVKGVLCGLVLTPAVALLLVLWRAHRLTRGLESRPGGGAPPKDLRARFTRYSAMNYFHQITTWLYDLDFVVFLSAAALGLTETALLGFAYKFARDILGFVWTPLTGVMTPLLARVKGREEEGALQDAQASLTRMIWLLLVPALAGLLLLAPGLLRTFYPRYAEAASLVTIFLVFVFAESLLSVPQNVLLVYERYRPVLLARAVVLLVVPLSAILLERFGPTGVALAVGAVRVASRLLALLAARRALGLSWPWGFTARVTLAASIMAALLALVLGRFADPATWGSGSRLLQLTGFLGLAGAGAVVYLLALRALGGLDAGDRRRLGSLNLPARGLLERLAGPLRSDPA